MQTEPRDWLDEHGDALYRLALRSLNSPEEAEDVVQDTLLQGIRGLSDFQYRCSVRTWLLSILKNRLVDYHRRLGRRPSPLAAQEWLEELPAESSTPESIVEEREAREQVIACIEVLPEAFREMFRLSEVDGYRHGELGERFQLTRGHVRVRLHRARLKVRDCLIRKGVGL
ncbi:sigma-70 family RNA polymerase sigma factor [bacterium]|nr:sigma-70 family RNA polymerase sigma factor [bacterium]